MELKRFKFKHWKISFMRFVEQADHLRWPRVDEQLFSFEHLLFTLYKLVHCIKTGVEYKSGTQPTLLFTSLVILFFLFYFVVVFFNIFRFRYAPFHRVLWKVWWITRQIFEMGKWVGSNGMGTIFALVLLYIVYTIQ